MKWSNSFSKVACVFFCLSLFTSCKKIIDHFFNNNGGPHEHDKECRIASVSDVYDQEDTVTYTIFYNRHGNPDSITPSSPWPFYPTYYYYFQYDDEQHLTSLTLLNEERNPHLRHYYGYNNHLITSDSIVDDVLNDIRVNTYRYDSKERIIRVLNSIKTETTRPDIVTEYVYDEDGNLQSPLPNNQARDYDDHKNFLSTHKLWQFLSKDYSENNERIAFEYNDQDLPLRFAQTTFFLADPYTAQDAAIIGVLNIKWDCRKIE